MNPMLLPKTTRRFSRLCDTRWRLACAGKCVFSIGIIAAVCLYAFVIMYTRDQSSAAAFPITDEHLIAIEQEQQLYESDIQALKTELHLAVEQRGIWARAEAALRNAFSEYVNIPPESFEADRTLVQRIDLVAAANLKSRNVQELCVAMRSLFDSADEGQRAVLERSIFPLNATAMAFQSKSR
jgi:hypothetical protein